MGAPVDPYRLWTPRMAIGAALDDISDPLAPRPTAGEQAKEDLQHMTRCLTGDGLRGRATVVSGDPAEATLYLDTSPPLAWV
jgi:hypothetical protein